MIVQKLLSKTKSLCPKCLKTIDAKVVDEEGHAYLIKECSKHGKFKVKHVWENTKTYNIITDIAGKKKKESNGLVVNVTTNCNLTCPYCYMNANEVPKLSISTKKIDKLLKNFKGNIVYLSGGEPTIVHDLCEKIQYIKKKGFKVVLFSNGKNLTKDYVKNLKKSGLDLVILQFDTFDEKKCKQLRGEAIVQHKLEALKNLKANTIPAYLFCMVAKDINIDEIGDILSFAAQNKNHIKIVNFQPVWHVGRVGKHENSSTELLLEKVLQESKLKKIDFAKSTQLSHIISSITNTKVHTQSSCEMRCYVFPYKDQLIPIHNIFMYEDVLKFLQNYHSKNVIQRILSFPLTSLTKSFFTNKYLRSFGIQSMKNLLTLGISMQNFPLLSINVGTFPDANNIDLNLTKHCNLHSDFPYHNETHAACVRQIFVNKDTLLSKNDLNNLI